MIPVSRLARVLVAVVLLLAVGVLMLAPQDARAAIIRIAVLVVGVTIAALYLRRSGSVTRSTPERFELELLQPAESVAPVPGIRAVEMAVRLSTASAQDYDVRLRPMLRDLAAWRLLGNRGVDMETKTDAARRILGAPLMGLIGEPSELPPFGARGISLADLNAGLDQLERI